MYLNVYHKPYAQRTTDDNIVQTRVGDRAGWPAAKHIATLLLWWSRDKRWEKKKKWAFNTQACEQLNGWIGGFHQPFHVIQPPKVWNPSAIPWNPPGISTVHPHCQLFVMHNKQCLFGSVSLLLTTTINTANNRQQLPTWQTVITTMNNCPQWQTMTAHECRWPQMATTTMKLCCHCPTPSPSSHHHCQQLPLPTTITSHSQPPSTSGKMGNGNCR